MNKVHEGRPHIQDRIKNGEYTYIINTTAGRRAIEDSRVIRRSALQYKVHYDTTLNGGFATTMALNADATEKVTSVQEMHAQIKKVVNKGFGGYCSNRTCNIMLKGFL